MGIISGKLIFAVLQGDDYSETVYALNQNGIELTVLNSTGGFLKKAQCDDYDRRGK